MNLPGHGVSEENEMRSSLCACWTPAAPRFSRIIEAKSLGLSVGGGVFRHAVDELVVLVDAEHAVRRQALDRERPGDAHLAVVGVRLVVEVLEVGLRSDGVVDLLLPRGAPFPPLVVQRPSLRRPLILCVAGDLPLLPRLAGAPRSVAPAAAPAPLRTAPRSRRLRRCWRCRGVGCAAHARTQGPA